MHCSVFCLVHFFIFYFCSFPCEGVVSSDMPNNIIRMKGADNVAQSLLRACVSL